MFTKRKKKKQNTIKMYFFCSNLNIVTIWHLFCWSCYCSCMYVYILYIFMCVCVYKCKSLNCKVMCEILLFIMLKCVGDWYCWQTIIVIDKYYRLRSICCFVLKLLLFFFMFDRLVLNLYNDVSSSCISLLYL